MYWTLELASKLEDAPWPASKEELIDYAMRSGAPMEVVENLQEMEDEGEIIGTMAVLFAEDPNYAKIYDGAWKTTEEPYVAIHRVAVDENCKGKGIAGAMMDAVEELCRERGVRSIKNDTHKDNKSMQRMQAKNGFEYCGVIYLEDGAERVAFEKIIE